MPYPESFIGPMRQELTRLGVQELRTAADVDAHVFWYPAGHAFLNDTNAGRYDEAALRMIFEIGVFAADDPSPFRNAVRVVRRG